MDRCLRHETVGQGKTQDATNEASASQQEEVPVESSWLLEWELACLCSQRRDIVIIVEQQHHQESEWQCSKHPFDVEMPKVDHPVPGLRWLEGADSRNAINLSVLEAARDPVKSYPEQGWKGEGVVGKDTAYPWLP